MTDSPWLPFSNKKQQRMHGFFAVIRNAVPLVLFAQTPSLSVSSFSLHPSSRTTTTRRSSFLLENRCMPFMAARTVPTEGPKVVMLSSSSSDDEFVSANDLEGLQKLFSEYCDDEGLMSQNSLLRIPSIAQLMAEGDLLEEELNDIWGTAPKFPDVTTSAARIDVDSFVQVYRDIDDLFEDENEESKPEKPVTFTDEQTETTMAPATSDQSEDLDKNFEDELESVFESIADSNGLISKQALMNWDEVEVLLSDGLLGAEEFEELWGKTKKSLGADDKLDIDGFLSFNVALDSLFEFSDEEMEEDEDEEIASGELVEEGERSPQELFALLAGSDGLVSKSDLMRWTELLELIDEGELNMPELDAMFSSNAVGGKLDQACFLALYKAIDDLFEYDDQEEKNVTATVDQKDQKSTTNNDQPSSKTTLLGMLEVLNGNEDLLPCGLEASEREQANILKVINSLEQEPSNLIRAKQGAVGESDFAGNWELVYSSSSAMKFNKGLSGLGGSFPNGKFGGLKMRLDSSKFMSDVEYTERISVTPEAASFDVSVTGDWALRQSVSLFTGEPSITMAITPERVNYGPTSTRADHWKSLGPLNMLDVAYLDKDLRIMRGSTSLDTVFVFRRVV